MNKELSDRVWKILPKEFKEEVKKEYLVHHKGGDMKYSYGYSDALTDLFGAHNLTSDAEEEEMLICEKSKVQKAYNTSREIVKAENPDSLMYSMHTQIMCVLESIFGSKCLPDEEHPKQKDCDNPLGNKEGCRWRNDGKCAFSSACYFEPLNPQEPQSAEPKFKHKIGDKVRIVNDISHNNKYNGDITEIVYVDESDPNMPYKVDIYDEEFGGGLWYQESDLEPYTEPKEKNHIAQDLEMVDNIIKDGFSKERRLNIAAMAMQGILANSHQELVDMKIEQVAQLSLEMTDALIAEAEKGGSNGED